MQNNIKQKIIAAVWAALAAGLTAVITSLANSLGTLDFGGLQQALMSAAAGGAAFKSLLAARV